MAIWTAASHPLNKMWFSKSCFIVKCHTRFEYSWYCLAAHDIAEVQGDCFGYVMCIPLYSIVFVDHPCTLGVAVYHQVPPCQLNSQSRTLRAVFTFYSTQGTSIMSVHFILNPGNVGYEHPLYNQSRACQVSAVNLFSIQETPSFIHFINQGNVEYERPFYSQSGARRVWASTLFSTQGTSGMSAHFILNPGYVGYGRPLYSQSWARRVIVSLLFSS